MKTLPSKSQDTSKRRGFRFWVGCFTLLLGLPLLLYYGYCWGVWGRYSLLLQYYFQCNCPSMSQEARYPKRVDVIVSSCSRPFVKMSPSGRLLYAREEMSGITTAYLLDLQTMQKIDLTDQSLSSFLTDDIWFLERGVDSYIIDRITGLQYPIQRFVYSHPDGQINGETNLPLLAESLRQAERVFLIGPSTDTVVALAANFRTHPERNFIANRFDLPGFGANRMERFLRESNINYHTILPDFPEEVVSPDGRFVARPDGIYVVTTGEKIVEGFSPSRFFRPNSRRYFMPRGWLYDGSGIIYSRFLDPCLIDGNLLRDDVPGCPYPVSQPVILLKIPDEYLLSIETP